MKVPISFGLWLTLMLLGWNLAFAQIPFDRDYVSMDQVTTQRYIMATIHVIAPFPQKMMVAVKPAGLVKPQWILFSTNDLQIDLGTNEGEKEVDVSFQWAGVTIPGGTQSAEKTDVSHVNVRHSPSLICITDPAERIVSQPMIQLKGFTSTDLEKPVHYQIFNQSGSVTASGDGIVGDRYFDKTLWAFTTNYFQCYDLHLSPGTNTIVIHTADYCGFSITTNFTCVFTTEGVVSGPSLKQVWPEDNNKINGSDFTMDGVTDDPTAKIVALVIDPNGEAYQKDAVIERNGRYWVDNLPLLDGRTYVTLIAKNAAGYTTVTNLSVRRSPYHLAMDPVVPASRLWMPALTITGTASLILTNYEITVNGVKAVMDLSGKWKAENVPVPEGGVAMFTIKAVSKDGHDEEYEPDPYPTVPITWGTPANGIKWGIYLIPGDTNHMNRQHCEVYVMNDSGANMNFQWMRPKQQALYSLHLYDNDRKEIPKSYSGRASFGRTETALPTATAPDLHHLDSKAIELIDGVLPLVTNAPVRVASFDVTDHYNNLPYGNYRLQIVGKLYQIEDTGKLTLLEAAPMTLPLKIVEQPPEMVCHLNDLQSQGQFSWGESTNQLRAGIAHNFEPQQVIKGDEIDVFLMNDSTNDLHNLLLPAPGQRFDLSLYDPLGKEVPKTTLGEQQGKPLSLAAHVAGVTPVFLGAKDAATCGRFNLNAYFEITMSGTYRLTYQQRLFQIGTDGIPELISLPAVTVPVQVQ